MSSSQQTGFTGVEPLGARLSKFLDCPVRFPGLGGNYMLCRHDITFPISRLLESENWDWVEERHKEWSKKKS